MQKDVQNLVSKQIFARWQAILSVFYFEIEFIKGSSNVLPDFLSREFLQGKMSKQDLIKPTTKESYAMSKGQTSNRFEVLGKILKPKVPASQNTAYIPKESKLLIQVLEADHKSASGSFELQKIFQKEKYFISNDISKTRRFYEFILVDMESIQVSQVKNPEGTDIAYSKCKILKSFQKRIGNRVLLLTNIFLKILFPKPLLHRLQRCMV